MSDSKISIAVYPEGRSFLVASETRLHEALAHAGISVPSPCGGNGTCRKCSLWLLPTDLLSEWEITRYNELLAQGVAWDDLRESFPFQETLTCRYVVCEPLIVWLPDRLHQPEMTKILTSHDQANGVAEGGFPLTFDLVFAPTDPVAASSDRHDLRLAPSQYLIAVDIGTTTVAAELLDMLSSEQAATRQHVIPWQSRGVLSCRNPQAEFGDDVISRIQYGAESTEHLGRLRKKIIGGINGLIAKLASNAGISEQQIGLIAIAGNTTMQQIFAGLDVTSLGRFPFDPAVRHYPVVRASEYGLIANPECRAIVFPVMGGFVGGDLVAGTVALQLRNRPDFSLLIDIGTNGEIVLHCPDGTLLAAATAAGPAFEGARIRNGMVAAPGAIERVTFDDDLHDLRFETIDNEPARGICGSGLIDLVAVLIRIGAVTSSGKLSGELLASNVSDAVRKRFVTVDNRAAFEIVPPSHSATGESIVLTQQDVRQVQLAAGAIRAGVTLLLRKAGTAPDNLAAVYLAGGFGNYIRRENAQTIGLLPPEVPVERIVFCGNTSLAGAKAVLLSADCYRDMQAVADAAECLDLSSFPDFSTAFAESMIFPSLDQ